MTTVDGQAPSDQMASFLKALEHICHKHGVTLWACSCCDGINIRRGHELVTLSDEQVFPPPLDNTLPPRVD